MDKLGMEMGMLGKTRGMKTDREQDETFLLFLILASGDDQKPSIVSIEDHEIMYGKWCIFNTSIRAWQREYDFGTPRGNTPISLCPSLSI